MAEMSAEGMFEALGCDLFSVYDRQRFCP